jgi:hypothetical protein
VARSRPVIGLHRALIALHPGWRFRAPPAAAAHLVIGDRRSVWAWREPEGEDVLWCQLRFKLVNPSRRGPVSLDRYYVVGEGGQRLATGRGWVRGASPFPEALIDEVVGSGGHSREYEVSGAAWFSPNARSTPSRVVVEGPAGLRVSAPVAAERYRSSSLSHALAPRRFDPLDVHHFELREAPGQRSDVDVALHMKDGSALLQRRRSWSEAVGFLGRLSPAYPSPPPPVVARDRYGLLAVLSIDARSDLETMLRMRLDPGAGPASRGKPEELA